MNVKPLHAILIVALAVALLAGFVVAIRGELRKARNKQEEVRQETGAAPARPTSRPHPMEAAIHWLKPKKTPLWMGVLSLVMILAMPLLIGIGFPESDDPEKACTRYAFNIAMWAFTGVMLVIFIPLVLKMRSTVSTRLGFRDEWVLVDHGNGSSYIARDNDLIRVNNGFIIDGVTIPTGNPKLTLYDGRELDHWLKPRLARGSSLGPVEQMTWQWHNHRGLFLLTVAGIIAGGILIVAMESGWLEQRFEEWLKTQPDCRVLVENQAAGSDPARHGD